MHYKSYSLLHKQLFDPARLSGVFLESFQILIQEIFFEGLVVTLPKKIYIEKTHFFFTNKVSLLKLFNIVSFRAYFGMYTITWDQKDLYQKYWWQWT